ncbi:uncharacterized protein EI90DRAFT_3021248 [Cantharellus anzutake]|uniref:uncharacterized protein n=1 Tax=Cantharellus anzutake TaxID=1750568 RepID=UPI0019087D6A|nr:uncharacterized protein EI90DRAFT_3021248 [Cantharellus anzutake]KAF8317847.1 hypothetical protein EI90DRAFT_3021248 [Cantharellus anzutake]
MPPFMRYTAELEQTAEARVRGKHELGIGGGPEQVTARPDGTLESDPDASSRANRATCPQEPHRANSTPYCTRPSSESVRRKMTTGQSLRRPGSPMAIKNWNAYDANIKRAVRSLTSCGGQLRTFGKTIASSTKTGAHVLFKYDDPIELGNGQPSNSQDETYN